MGAAVDRARIDLIPLFASLGETDREEVAAHVREVTVPAGEVLARQGDYAYELFVVERGEAEVRKDGELIRTLGPHDVFGEVALLATGARTASVIATTPMTLIAVFAREFEQLTRRHPELARTVRELMRERIERAAF